MEEEDDGRLIIFGYSKSRLEVFLNGIAFLIIQVSQEILSIAIQLPKNWTQEDLAKVDRPFVISILLFSISYFLINFALFGGGRMEKLEERFGVVGVFARRCIFILAMALINLYLPIYIIKIFL